MVVFDGSTQAIETHIDETRNYQSELLQVDRWIASSLLQKSIRRGEVGIAERAALTLFVINGRAIWRRLIVIAFEDVGAGSVDAVAATVALSVDASFGSSTAVTSVWPRSWRVSWLKLPRIGLRITSSAERKTIPLWPRSVELVPSSLYANDWIALPTRRYRSRFER